jgi:type II secretory pathway pseudopilin PulG
LLELIIVITIIAVLAALTTGVAMRFFGIQQQRNTEVTITKAFETLKRQWDEVISEAMTEKLPPDGPPPTDPSYPSSLRGIYETQIAAFANDLDPVTGFATVPNPFRARVIWVKARLRQQFPMDFTEILLATPPSQLGLGQPPGWFPQPPGALPALPTYYKALINAGVTGVNPPSDAENSSCLLMALSETRGGIAFNSDNMGTGAVGDTDNNGLLEILDGWKRPIRFFRWPTGNSEVDRLNPAPLGSKSYSFRDPQDPDGLLLTTGPAGSANGWWSNKHTAAMNGAYPFETLFHAIFIISAYAPSDTRNVPADPNYTVLGPYPAISPPFGSLVSPAAYNPYYIVPHSYYSMPVLASAGPNKNFGLLQVPAGTPDPMAPIALGYPGYGDDADNIYSYRLRLGAPGN